MDETGNSNSSSTTSTSTSTNTNNNIIIGSGGGGGFLDTSKADRVIWLLKCPTLVSRSLHRTPSPSSAPPGPADSLPVAKVILSLDPLKDGDSDKKFTMELTGTGSGNEPKSYSMNMSKDLVPMSVFCESSQGKLSVAGKIINKFDMKPSEENLESYRKFCRERTNKYMTKGRQIQVIDNYNGINMRPMPGMVASGPFDKKKQPIKSSETKRTRRDRGEMEAIMFKLFEGQPNWTLRQLIQETDQPEQFLKDILKDLCVYNNKGSNQGSYELKPEYKKSGEEPGS